MISQVYLICLCETSTHLVKTHGNCWLHPIGFLMKSQETDIISWRMACSTGVPLKVFPLPSKKHQALDLRRESTWAAQRDAQHFGRWRSVRAFWGVDRKLQGFDSSSFLNMSSFCNVLDGTILCRFWGAHERKFCFGFVGASPVGKLKKLASRRRWAVRSCRIAFPSLSLLQSPDSNYRPFDA